MPLLKEFLNENAHRYYPFESTNKVPTALILDFGVIATTNLPLNSSSSSDSTYISKIVTDGVQIRFYLAARISGVIQDFGCIATVHVEAPSITDGSIGTRTNFSYAGNGFVLEGFIHTGDTTVAQQMAPVTTLDASTGRIYTGCIQHMSNWLSGIQIGDQTLSGVITLVAGAGVDLSVDSSTKTIVISCTGAEIPLANQIITSDADLLDQVTTLYGVPISAINGISVSDAQSNDGNWELVTRSEDGLAVTVNANTASITITDINARACCSQDEIAGLVDNIGVLNQRVGIIQTFISGMENNMNTLSAQIARLS
jgi:hypothetical protein